MFTVYTPPPPLSLSLICMKVRDSDFLAWVQGQRKMSHILGVFWLMDLTMLPLVLALHTF
jgi:hypothetical protein